MPKCLFQIDRSIDRREQLTLGVMEDPSNRNRLAKLLRFRSSNDPTEQTALSAYVERMREKQPAIFYVAGTSRAELESSPFVERLLAKGYEVLYLTEAVDEYAIQVRFCLFVRN